MKNVGNVWKETKNASEQRLRDPSPNYSKCEKWSDETIKRVKRRTTKQKKGGGEATQSLLKRKNTYIMEKEQNTNV